VWGIAYDFSDLLLLSSGLDSWFQEVLAGKARAQRLNIQVGIKFRIYNERDFIMDVKNYSISELDFVILHFYETFSDRADGPTVLARRDAERYAKLKVELHRLNSKLEIIHGGDTTLNHTPQNLLSFWKETSTLAVKKKVQVYMHQAFDQPSSPAFYAEINKHYGWWKRRDNGDMASYVQKIDGA